MLKLTLEEIKDEGDIFFPIARERAMRKKEDSKKRKEGMETGEVDEESTEPKKTTIGETTPPPID
jgi:hypothetical protein